MFEKVQTVAKKLESTKADFFKLWKQGITDSKLKYPDLNVDFVDYGSKIFDEIITNIKTDRHHGVRIIKLGTDIGLQKALDGRNLEIVLDLYILFRSRLWKHIRNISADLELTTDDFFELEKRVDLYIDHIIESIAFSFVATKEQAVIDLIAKTLK